MLKFITQNRKWVYRLLIILVIAFFCVYTQINLMQVKADVIPITVNLGHIGFGNVFPGENLEKYFTISYNNQDNGQTVNYKIIQKIKPLPDAVPPANYVGTINQYCQEYPENNTLCYRNLCPYLLKVGENGENDLEDGAILSKDDLTDTWTVKLAVPAFFGQVSQNHAGEIVTANGEYGCDISIDVDDEICAISGYKFNDLDHDGVKDEGENGLANWTINLNLPESELIFEELDALATGEIATTDNILENGDNFRIEASGTYFAGGNSPQDIEADAKYSQDDYQALNNLPWTDSVHNYESYGSDLLNLKVNGIFADWGVFNTGHIYSLTLPGNGALADFQIYDIAPGNNTGSMHVKIFKIQPAYNDVKITDNNGFYCFQNLPRDGAYTISEVTQTGWTNSTPIERTENYSGASLININFGNFQPSTGTFRSASFSSSNTGGSGLTTPQNSEDNEADKENISAKTEEAGNVTASPTPDLITEPVIVAGAELIPTGFSNKEFIILFSFLFVLFFSVRVFKKIIFKNL